MENEDTSRGMWIPTIGDEVTLARNWKFGLYYEYRNEAMISLVFPDVGTFKWRNMVLPNGSKPEYGDKIADVVLLAGAVLKVDRIYIRKGGADMKEFDSVTFILQSLPKSKIAIPKERDVYIKDGVDRNGHTKYKTEKRTSVRKKARFWAKLRDVNQMRFYMGREEVKEEAAGRLIRLGEGWEDD